MGAGRWAQRALGARVLGERACGRRWACVGARVGAAGSWTRGRRAQRQAERAAGGARGRRSARQAGRAAAARRARGARRQRAASAGRHGVGAQGRAAGRTERAGHGRPGRWMGAQASWASFGALCTWLNSGSVFGPGSTLYFLESPNEHCSL